MGGFWWAVVGAADRLLGSVSAVDLGEGRCSCRSWRTVAVVVAVVGRSVRRLVRERSLLVGLLVGGVSPLVRGRQEGVRWRMAVAARWVAGGMTRSMGPGGTVRRAARRVRWRARRR